MRVSYLSGDGSPATLMPRLPLSLSYRNRAVDVIGLIDTGSTVNVLPYSLGLSLGAEWQPPTTPIALVGSLQSFEVNTLVVMATHPDLTGRNPVRLVFAWVKSDRAPVIFGQMNFFLEFDVCFYRSQAVFEIARHLPE
jgi:hypothetical protein